MTDPLDANSPHARRDPMLSTQGTMLVAAPRHRVYDLFVDIDRLSDRISSITRSEFLTDGGMRDGARVRFTRRLQGGKVTYDARYCDVVPGESFCEEVVLNGTHQSTIVVFADENGLTRVDYSFDLRPLAFLTKLLWKLLGAVVRKQVKDVTEQQFQEFKAYAEAEASSNPALA